jgi:hypothetical protein
LRNRAKLTHLLYIIFDDYPMFLQRVFLAMTSIYERRRRVRETLLGTQAHDRLDTIVQEIVGHYHTIGFTVVGNEFEDTTCGHCVC